MGIDTGELPLSVDSDSICSDKIILYVLLERFPGQGRRAPVQVVHKTQTPFSNIISSKYPKFVSRASFEF